MFDGLISFISGVWDVFRAVIVEAWRQCSVTLGSAWTILLACVGVVWWAIDKVGSAVAQMVAIVDAIVFPDINTTTTGIGYWLSVGNTVLPISETLAFLVTFGALVLALTTYRLIKSWIPTLS